LLFYTHLTSILILPVQFIIQLWFIKQKPKLFFQLSISQVVSVILLSFWLFNNSWFGGNETTWMVKPDLKKFLEMYFFFFNKKIGSIVVLVTIVTFLILIYKNRKSIVVKSELNYKLLTVLLWGFLPVLIMFLISIIYNPRFIPRYMLYSTIGVYIGFAYLLSHKLFSEPLRWILVILFLAGSIVRLDLNPSKGEEWKPAFNYYNEIKTPNTMTLVSIWYQWISFSYYFNKEYFIDNKNVLNKLTEENIFFTDSIDVINYYNINNYDKIILILCHYKVVDPKEKMLNNFLNIFPVYELKKFKGIRIYTFDLNNNTSN